MAFYAYVKLSHFLAKGTYVMNDDGLFEATVPVFQHYLQSIDALLSSLTNNSDALLQKNLALHAFCAAEHFQTAFGFVQRTVCPLLGREVQEPDEESCDRASLILAGIAASSFLAELSATDFDGASSRLVKHTAGTAKLEQSSTTFVTLFCLPNFFFHLTMGFAILRREGTDIGKADFDGLHAYAPGFHF